MKKIFIYGCGMFGFALAKHFGNKYSNNPEYEIISYDRNVDVVNCLNRYKIHPFHHFNNKLSEKNIVTNDINKFTEGCTVLILVVPSQSVREVMRKLSCLINNDLIIVNTAKSLEIGSNKLISEVIDEEMQCTNFNYTIAQFSGGTIAKDLANGAPLGADIACQDDSTRNLLQELFSSEKLKIYSTTDLVGVEYAGAFKNIISILAGIVSGLGLPYGSETHLISRAAKEAKDIAVQLGANEHTFSIDSQSWGNDLWMSCTGNTRNRYFGELIGQGLKAEDALRILEIQHKVVEGYNTAKIIPNLIKKAQYKSSILLQVYNILYTGKDCETAINEIMRQ